MLDEAYFRTGALALDVQEFVPGGRQPNGLPIQRLRPGDAVVSPALERRQAVRWQTQQNPSKVAAFRS
jgi:hypothetical protein